MSLFDQQSTPALSFKNAPVGTSYTGRVTKAPELVQSRDFETGEPAVWPDGNPKMTAVLNLDVEGTEFALWAPKPSALFAALGQAEKAAGVAITAGGALTVTFTGEKPNSKNPRLNPQKLYTVTYRPGSAFNDDTAAPQATPAVTDSPKPAAPPAADLTTSIATLLNLGLANEAVVTALAAQGHNVDAATVQAAANALGIAR